MLVPLLRGEFSHHLVYIYIFLLVDVVVVLDVVYIYLYLKKHNSFFFLLVCFNSMKRRRS